MSLACDKEFKLISHSATHRSARSLASTPLKNSSHSGNDTRNIMSIAPGVMGNAGGRSGVGMRRGRWIEKGETNPSTLHGEYKSWIYKVKFTV